MKGIVSVAAALLLAAPAQADQVLPVMQKAGLMGTWAANCDAPEAANNPFVVYYVAANGLVRRRLERGAAGPTLDGTVDRAEALGPCCCATKTPTGAATMAGPSIPSSR
jgi:hypothetical protein